MRRAAFAIVAAFVASDAVASAPAPASAPASAPAPASASASAPAYDVDSWAASTSSPTPLDLWGSALAPYYTACGKPDERLRDTAARLVARKLRGEPMPDADELALEQRAAGEPHVWGRAWAIAGKEIDRKAVLAKLEAWAHAQRAQSQAGVARCGIAEGARADGTQVIAAVSVDAVADLSPLPMRVHPGMWMTLDATLLVGAVRARVLVSGPDGTPRTVPTSFAGQSVRARFAADRPGQFTVQVLAEVAGGPRPVLEATILADVDPPARLEASRAPGEEAGQNPNGATDPNDALARMIAATRVAAGIGPLVRDPRLDALARAHAIRMREARAVAHDLQDGDPLSRLEAAGLFASRVGENAAHAADVAHAHRALWRSPSHKANLLRQEFDHVGVAVIEDADGSVWVCEELADDLR